MKIIVKLVLSLGIAWGTSMGVVYLLNASVMFAFVIGLIGGGCWSIWAITTGFLDEVVDTLFLKFKGV